MMMIQMMITMMIQMMMTMMMTMMIQMRDSKRKKSYAGEFMAIINSYIDEAKQRQRGRDEYIAIGLIFHPDHALDDEQVIATMRKTRVERETSLPKIPEQVRRSENLVLSL